MNVVALEGIVRDAVRDVLVERGLNVPDRPAVSVQRPSRRELGDYATSVALRHAADVGVPPREFAAWLAGALAGRDGVAAAEVAGAGFVNVRLSAGASAAQLREVLDAGRDYGRDGGLAGRSVRIDAPPADPAAEWPLDGARRCVVGDALARMVAARGGEAVRAGAAPPAAGPRTVAAGRSGAPATRRDFAAATLRDLVATVGHDAARYALVRAVPDAELEIDLDVLSSRTDANPVFQVQYAHARLAALARGGTEMGIARAEEHGEHGVHGDLRLLDDATERDVIRTLGEFPGAVRAATERSEPHRVARLLESLAGAYQRFHDACRVLPMGDEPVTDRHRARLSLCAATRQVFANGLGLLAVGAPERV